MKIDNEDEISSSIISTTRYGHNSAKILGSIEKNFVIVIVIIAATFVFSSLDSAGLLKYLDLYSETAHDTIATIFSIISLAAMIPLLAYIVKSRRMIERWQNLFERNSLKTSMEISLTGVSKKEIVRALAESIEEISEPLREYLNAAEGKEKSTVAFQGREHSVDLDVLIDSNYIGGSSASPAGDKLKAVLREFGSVCVKVSRDSESVDAAAVESFISALSTYVANTGNKVGLGLLIGRDVEPEAYRALEASASVNAKKFYNLLIIEKPMVSSIQ